jgi:hypothetical protein
MSRQRLKRLQRLEARKPTRSGEIRDACMRLWAELEPVVAGRACLLPEPEPKLSLEAAFEAAMRRVNGSPSPAHVNVRGHALVFLSLPHLRGD